MLNSDATLEIARGLQHPNTQVARTAYRTLDAQITGWSQLEASVAMARMRALAGKLAGLSDETPPDNLVLASSLASRIFTMCLELDDPQLAPVMTACESVFQRVARPAQVPASFTAQSTQSRLETANAAAEIAKLKSELNQLRPPPPLNASAATRSLSDEQFTEQNIEQNIEQNTGQNTGQYTPIAASDNQHSSTGNPAAHVQFLTAATRPRTPTLQPGRASISLSDKDGASDRTITDYPSLQTQSLTQSALIEAPEGLVQTVATVPIVRMRKLSLEVDVAGIPGLPIDELVRLLASSQPQVAQTAALALRQHNFSDELISLASELATCSPVRRIELLQQIATADMDPRPWLIWMAEDGQPEVRQEAITLLSRAANQVYVQGELRRLLNQEQNDQVAQTIRQALASPARSLSHR